MITSENENSSITSNRSLSHSPVSLSLSLSLSRTHACTHARTHTHTHAHTQEEFGRKYPRLMKPMLHERDMFLAYVLRIQGPCHAEIFKFSNFEKYSPWCIYMIRTCSERLTFFYMYFLAHVLRIQANKVHILKSTQSSDVI